MRGVFFIIVLSFTWKLTAQDPKIETDLPTIIPPSPTVAALMRFEEIQVSNYTGVPEISIPLMDCKTHSKDINFSLRLSYDSNSNRVDEVAGYTGIGWSLNGSIGTISRTVKGLPDEKIMQGSSPKYGVYYQNTGVFMSRFNEFMNLIGINNPGIMTEESLQKYIWEASEKGYFDTEYDLYQYNFFGYSGRFYIKKEGNAFVVVKLDTNPLVIEYNNQEQSFLVTDDKGYRYYFTEKEVTTTATLIESIPQFPDTAMPTLPRSETFVSAYQLTSVLDNNDKTLVSYTYEELIESQVICNRVFNKMDDADREYIHNLMTFSFASNFPNGADLEFSPSGCFETLLSNLEPREKRQKHLNLIRTKKIATIDVHDFAQLEFNNEVGFRNDFTNNSPENLPSLKSIVLKYGTENIKKIEFEYDYNPKLTLVAINNYNSDFSAMESTSFSYSNMVEINADTPKDYWGYPTKQTPCIDKKREASPADSFKGLLNKIVYPTGGCTVFQFETNTYSHKGNVLVEDFSSNPDNFPPTTITEGNLTSDSQANSHFDLGSAPYSRVIYIKASLDQPESNIILQPGGESVVSECPIRKVLLPNVNYSLFFVWLDSQSVGGGSYTIYEEIPNNNPSKEFLYGGGNRIKKIGNFTQILSETEFNDYLQYDIVDASVQTKLASEKKFDYSFFDFPNRSSGSLVFEIPVFNYSITRQAVARCDATVGNFPFGIVRDYTYDVTTDYNNLNFTLTKGSHVGYKNVRVDEICRSSNCDNGYREYEYDSPIDFPEPIDDVHVRYPFIPTVNLDHKRGQMRKERYYGQNMVKEILYDYNHIDFEETVGFRFYYPETNCAASQLMSTYDFYVNTLNPTDNCAQYSDITFATVPQICHFYCGTISDFISYEPIKVAFGRTELKTKITKNYFYDVSNSQSILETKEDYTYFPINNKISEYTLVNSNQETMKTKYYYHIGNSAFSQNRISEIEKIETYKGNELLTQSQINYNSMWNNNVSYLPQTISTSKGTGALENKVRYLNYDEFGNPLELQQENGTIVSYIWGYNKTLPIAKIENATYTQFSSLASSLQALSNQNNEAALLTALDSLRVALPNAMVTTYTYKPLVGVETITDPKGNSTRYDYDLFGRLSAVYDSSGNKLSENIYHFRPLLP